MTGYESKRAAAQDKLDDDDTQVYQDDALTIAYQSGYYDGKKAAQPAQEPINVRAKFLSENIVESIDCGDAAGAKATLEMLTALAQPAQEPFGYFRYDARLDAWVQNCGNNQGTPFYTTPPQRKPLNKEPPPWWPAVENILNEYGLQAVDFVADFKNALAQPEQEPVATLFGTLPVYDNTPALPAQEPVAWLCSPDENGLFELPTTHKACKDCFPVYTTLPQPAQEREALKLALEVLENLPGFRADIDNAITVIKDVLEKTHEN